MPDVAPTRRSPLDAVHERLGARWRSDGSRWPESYADTADERRTVETAAGVGEIGPFDKLLAHGPGVAETLRSLGIDASAGHITSAAGPGRITTWVLADDEAILVQVAAVGSTAATRSGAEGEPGGAETLAAAADALRAAGCHVVDLGSGLSVLRLAGPQARPLLEELVPIDLSPAVFADATIARVPMANCRVTLARQDGGSVPGFTLLVARDETEHLWEVLLELGADHGVEPVGSAALRPATGTSAAESAS